jgi:hypothetical protein
MCEQYSTMWAGIRTTDDLAEPICWRKLSGPFRRIFVTRATIRNAMIENEYFALASSRNTRPTYGPGDRVEVQCLWYGRKPPNTCMHLTLQGEARLVSPEEGAAKVVWNIGRS